MLGTYTCLPQSIVSSSSWTSTWTTVVRFVLLGFVICMNFLVYLDNKWMLVHEKRWLDIIRVFNLIPSSIFWRKKGTFKRLVVWLKKFKFPWNWSRFQKWWGDILEDNTRSKIWMMIYPYGGWFITKSIVWNKYTTLSCIIY